VFYFLFGWLMGRNIRATRQTAYNAALPEAEKQRLFDARQSKMSAKQARKAANRAMWKEHPGQVLLGWGVLIVVAIGITTCSYAIQAARHDPAVPVPDTTYNTVPAPHPPTSGQCVFGAPPGSC
jgi:hypothetical protein